MLSIYKPISTMSSRIFFTLESMANIHYLYQWSLYSFMELMQANLDSEELKKIDKQHSEDRLKVMTRELFITFNHACTHGLLNEHQMLLQVRLA